MVTIHRFGAFRIVIFTDDHEPAHVHVIGDGEVRIDLRTLEILTNKRMSKRDAAKAVEEVKEQQEAFLLKWSEIHERD